MFTLRKVFTNYDIIIPWGISIFLFFFLYPLSVFFVLLFPLIIFIYKKKNFIKTKYRFIDLKRKVNYWLYFLGIIFLTIMPISGKDYLYDAYQENIVFSCFHLNSLSEFDFLDNISYWYKTEDSLPILFNKIQTCHTEKAVPMLIHLELYSPVTSNELNRFHELGHRPYKNQPVNLLHYFMNFDTFNTDYNQLLDNYLHSQKINDIAIRNSLNEKVFIDPLEKIIVEKNPIL